MDMKLAIEALGITREEVLERAAQVIAKNAADYDYVADSASALIKARVDDVFSKSVTATISAKLDAEMEKLLAHEYTPVDLWGEATGKPTTLRASLHDQAKKFWELSVDKDGRAASYGGKPRYEYLFEKMLTKEFTGAVSQNITNIVGAIKDALKDNAAKEIDAHINKIIGVTTQRDKRS